VIGYLPLIAAGVVRRQRTNGEKINMLNEIKLELMGGILF
jgi:hypothetical protein